MTPKPNSEYTNTGVLLVGHGTRDAIGTRQFFELEERLSERLPAIPVAAALLEFQTPTIPEAWNQLISLGVTHIHVAPLLLFAAGHAKQDIPAILAECQAEDPTLTFDQSRPLSRHAAIIDLVLQRLGETLASCQHPPRRTVIVMVGRGSHDPCAQADMRILSEITARKIDVAEVVTAFYAMAEPRLPAILDEVAETGRFDAVVVHPHLLFEGRLNQAIIRQTKEAAVKYRSLQWLTSAYLGPDACIADAIAARIGMT
ncbi:MAG: sirohydrochlorin chelatase [Rubripirellula sp.]|nr:sirohydrochlorin chelatase [Rubripirellula sp.]